MKIGENPNYLPVDRKQVNSPRIGSIVRHTGWRKEDDPNYPCDVLIEDGQFESHGRVSNYWYWRRVLPDNTLSEREHGYGSFEVSDNQYKITTIVEKVISVEKI